ncbi:MAG: hypothetical protein WCK05_00055 [Planctomycetota bacterium]
MTQATQSDPHRPAQGQAPSDARAVQGLARTLAVLGAVVGGMGVALAFVCLATGLPDLNAAWLAAGAGFLLVGMASGVTLWVVGRLAGTMAWLSLEIGERTRRVEVHSPAPPDPATPPQAHRTEDHQSVLEAIEQLRADVLLTDEQRRARAARTAAARVVEGAARFREELADGRLEAAEEKFAELAAIGASEEQIAPLQSELVAALVRQAEESIMGGQLEQARRCMEQIARLTPGHEQLSSLRDRLLTFFAERADRAILGGDFRRGQDWIDEFAQAGPDDLRIVELRSRLRQARAGVMAGEFARQKKCVEDMLAVADYDHAEIAAEDMIDRMGANDEVKAFVAQVKGEATAFREEQRRRMLAEMRQYAESRQWRKALDAARELAAEHPQSRQAEEVRGMLQRIEENARIEEVRQLRDRIADLIERKRFAEAVEVAEDVIDRFPDTQAAGQLAREIDKLRKRAGTNDLL